MKAGKLERTGKGGKGDPFRYKFLFSCSPHISETREQESENQNYPVENQGRILVPETYAGLEQSPESREQELLLSVEDDFEEGSL